jgi:hypothetical protein
MALSMAIAALLTAGCGGLSTSKLDGEVKDQIVASEGGVDNVKSVECTDTPAPPPATMPAVVGAVHAEHTCTVTFTDGKATQVWAVHVLDLEVSHAVQLLYQVNGPASQPAPTVDVSHAFSTQMAVLESGHAVSGVRCRVGSPTPPSGASFGTADHICSARVSGAGRQRWAVRIVGTNVQLLFKLS